MNLQGIPERTSTRWRIVAAVIVAVAIGAIVSTYDVFNNFYDEPAHIATGMEWLSKGTFTLEPQHPPLSRVASAFLPWLDGGTSHGFAHIYIEGREILGRGEHYQRTLSLARAGQLPFFVVLAFVVWAWARRLSDERTAAFAVFLIAANPNILAHAGVAGTDIGPAAMMPAALLALSLWLEAPTVRRSLWAGAALALCGLTKFSAGAYWLVAAAFLGVAYVGIHSSGERIGALRRLAFKPVVAAMAAAALVTWAMYRFDVGTFSGMTVPAPEFWEGLKAFFRHGTRGHPAYLLGESRDSGWWYYDIVALAVKTPIALILLGLLGDSLSFRALRSQPLIDRTSAVAPSSGTMPRLALHAGVISVLLLASITPVDLGVRLDLPIYAMMSVAGALALSHLLAAGRVARSTGLLLGAWLVATPIAARPDFISYFNAFAGREPANVLVDSNLDWGQDLYRLRDAWNEIGGTDSLRIHYFGSTEFLSIGLSRARRLRPDEHVTGWVAASETFYRGLWADSSLNWLRPYKPVAEIGTSIRLYHIVPAR